jgi:hypothetical protein
VQDNGDFIIVWQSWLQDGALSGVYGQQYSANGNRIGGEFRVNQTTSFGEYPWAVSANGADRFVVVFGSELGTSSNNEVFARVYQQSPAEPPVSSKIADVTVHLDAPNHPIDLFAAFQDAFDSDSQMNYGLIGNTNPSLFRSIEFDSATGHLTLDFARNGLGTSRLTVRATNSRGRAVNTSFLVTASAIIGATEGHDVIHLRQVAGQFQAFVNASLDGIPTHQFPISQLTDLTLDTFDGDDTIVIVSALPWMPTIRAGGGNDTLTVHAGLRPVQ